MKPLLISCLLFLSAIGATGCGKDLFGQSRDQKSRDPSTMDRAALLDALRAKGVSVEADGDVEQPFLSITGQMVKIHGEDVQIFEYPDAATMEAQAARVSPDGSTIGAAKPFWVGTPHFFKRGKLLVLYVGEEDRVSKTLEAIMGRQFAGK